MPASAELVDICQAHLDLLRRTFGEVSSVIYLTLGIDADAKPILVPVAQMPESDDLSDLLNPTNKRDALPASADMDLDIDALSPRELADAEYLTLNVDAERLVLPLMHQDMVLGVLACRKVRPYSVTHQYVYSCIINLLVVV